MRIVRFPTKYTIWGSWGWLGAPALYHLCSARRGPDRVVSVYRFIGVLQQEDVTATCARWATPFNAQQQRCLRLLSARADCVLRKLKTVFVKFESGTKVRKKEFSQFAPTGTDELCPGGPRGGRHNARL